MNIQHSTGTRFNDEDDDDERRELFRLFPASRKVGLGLLKGFVDEAFKQLERLRLLHEEGQSNDLKNPIILLRKCFVFFKDLDNVLENEEEDRKELNDILERCDLIDFCAPGIVAAVVPTPFVIFAVIVIMIPTAATAGTEQLELNILTCECPSFPPIWWCL